MSATSIHPLSSLVSFAVSPQPHENPNYNILHAFDSFSLICTFLWWRNHSVVYSVLHFHLFTHDISFRFWCTIFWRNGGKETATHAHYARHALQWREVLLGVYPLVYYLQNRPLFFASPRTFLIVTIFTKERESNVLLQKKRQQIYVNMNEVAQGFQ